MKRTIATFSIAMIFTTSLLAANTVKQPKERQDDTAANPFDPNNVPEQNYVKGRGKAQSLADTESMPDPKLLGAAPNQVDVVGDHLTTKQKHQFVSRLTRLMNENWDSINDQERLDACHAWLKYHLSDDPRLALAMGLLMEKHNKLDEALHWYHKSRTSRPAIPYFGAWQRSILVRLRRRDIGDIDAAMNESVELVKGVAQLARYHRHEINDIDHVLANNVYFVGRVLAFLEQPAHRKGRGFLVNTQSDDYMIQAQLSRLPSDYDYPALYATAKLDLGDLYLAKQNIEDQTEARNKREAMANNKREKQGEIERRRTWGPHAQAPNAFDYYEERGGGPRGLRIAPLFKGSRETSDKKWNDEWFKVIEPWYRRPPRRSQYVSSYFPMNIESERRKLLETFPERYDGGRWTFVTR